MKRHTLKAFSVPLFVVAFAVIFGALAFSAPTASAQSVPIVEYRIQPGDTLSKIAQILHHLGRSVRVECWRHRTQPECAGTRHRDLRPQPLRDHNSAQQ